MSKPEFKPITLTNCDEARVKKNGGKSYQLPFNLSTKPPREWEDRFEQVWKSLSRQQPTQRAKAFVKKRELVLISPLSDVSFHFTNLNSAIDITNTEYLESLQKNDKNSEKKRQREEKEAEERLAIQEAIAGLSFSTPEAIPDE
jgi:hypothetical protein